MTDNIVIEATISGRSGKAHFTEKCLERVTENMLLHVTPHEALHDTSMTSDLSIK